MKGGRGDAMQPWAPRAQTSCRQISTSLELNSSRPADSRFSRSPTYNGEMARHEEFTHVEPDLRPILEELRFAAAWPEYLPVYLYLVPGGADHATGHDLAT